MGDTVTQPLADERAATLTEAIELLRLGRPPVFRVLPRDDEPRVFVYFVGRADLTGPIKIGKSENPEARLKGIQAGSPYRLAIYYTTEARPCVEGSLHYWLSSHRLQGEWFARSAALVAMEHVGRLVEADEASDRTLRAAGRCAGRAISDWRAVARSAWADLPPPDPDL